MRLFPRSKPRVIPLDYSREYVGRNAKFLVDEINRLDAISSEGFKSDSAYIHYDYDKLNAKLAAAQKKLDEKILADLITERRQALFDQAAKKNAGKQQ